MKRRQRDSRVCDGNLILSSERQKRIVVSLCIKAPETSIVTSTERVLQQFTDQALACEQLGSPFTARLCQVLARRLDRRSSFGRTILDWPGDPYADNIALRACGSIHALARSGWEPNLSKVYPPNPTSENAVWTALADALHHNDVFLTDRLASPPQTNEIGRSGILLGALLHLSAIVPYPIELFEIGASAGLNLGVDDYHYELGEGRNWGVSDALTIECEWRGASPRLNTPLHIVGRHGCDINPLDPLKEEDRNRLLSYIWADQIHRLRRTEAALRLAASRRRTVDRADASVWLAEQLARPAPSRTTRVVFHTIVWPYIAAASKAQITDTINRAGEAASADSPFARLSVEPDEVPGSARVELTLWPSHETRVLGRADFHGRWVEWN